MKQRGFALIIIIIVIALVAITGAYFTRNKGLFDNPPRIISTSPSPISINTPSSTTGWKTYTNTILGYSLKYPPEVTYKEISEYGDVVFYLKKEEKIEYDFVSCPRLEILDRSSWANNPYTVANDELTGREFKVIKFNNVQGVKVMDSDIDLDYYLGPSNPSENSTVIRPSFTDFPYVISPDSKENTLNIFNQIISTIRFINTENISQLTGSELDRGWYWGNEDQKKPGTPESWVFTEAGRSSCWHKPGTDCDIQ